ncbi:MAG: hypothetical protein HPZ91_00125 [Lentisphaeria bacterium]|nr:hypothetical protein [Lentisphaeria bacterium]
MKFPNRILSGAALGAALILALPAAESLSVGGAGELKAGGIPFRILCVTESGRGAMQGAGGFRLETQTGTLKNYSMKAIMRNESLPQCALTIEIRETAEGASHYAARLECARGAKLSTLALAGELSSERFRGSTLLLDGKKLRLPDAFISKGMLFKGRISELAVPSRERKLLFRGDFELEVEELNSSVRLSLLFSPARGNVKKASLELTLHDLPYAPAVPLDLRNAFNMGFADDVAEDRRGGWTDQGAGNDLRSLQPGRRNFGGVDFVIADPHGNGGKGCIVLAGPNRSYFPGEAATGVKGSGKYLYLLHALAWAVQDGEIGTIELSYADGSAKSIPVHAGVEAGNWHHPASLDNGQVAWTGENGDNYIGLYRSCFPIDDKPLRSVAFRSNGRSVWGIVAASLMRDEIPAPKSTPLYILPGRDWKEIANYKEVEPGSALDFSARLDAPAGKYGPVVIRNGKLFFRDRPEKPLRFYGTNLNFTTQYLEKEEAERLADRLAAAGYNAVRIHHHDNFLRDRKSGDSSGFAAENLDRLEYLIACLKKRGIYITSDLFVSRKFDREAFPELPGLGDKANFKALVFVASSAMENWKRFARNWLTHVNPYTGLALRDEPALISLSLINEGNIASTWRNEPVASLYRGKFAEWEKSSNSAAALAGVHGDIRFAAFLTELYAGRYEEMRDYLRSLGVNVMLTDQNMHVQILHSVMRDRYDYVDNHRYWDHPSFPVNPWRLPSAHHNRSALEKLAYPSQIMPSRLFGKPFFLTEFDFARPNRFRAEGAVITGAYASVQDWDALFHFAYAHGREVAFRDDYLFTQSGHFDSVVDPVKSLSQRIGLALFLNGELAPSPLVFAALTTDAPSLSFSRGYPQEFGQLGLIARVGSIVMPGGRFDAAKIPPGITGFVDSGVCFPAGVTGAPVFRGTGLLKELCRKGVLKQEYYRSENGVFRTPDGAVAACNSERNFRVVTPKCEALILPPGKRLPGEFLEVENQVGRGVFSVIALDGRALAQSERILFLHLTDTLPTMAKFSDKRRAQLESWGKLPLLAERGEALVTLAAPPGEYTLYALNLAGKRLAEIPLTRSDSGKLRFKADIFGGEDARLAYELVRRQ